jgi:hypothetical protein
MEVTPFRAFPCSGPPMEIIGDNGRCSSHHTVPVSDGCHASLHRHHLHRAAHARHRAAQHVERLGTAPKGRKGTALRSSPSVPRLGARKRDMSEGPVPAAGSRGSWWWGLNSRYAVQEM